MLSADKIKKMLKDKYPDMQILVYDSVDSTNTEARRRRDISMGIIAAKAQTAGRGRQGHSFYSPADTGLYMSVILPITPAEAYEFMLTSAAAVACARAIEKQCRISPGIKWVNDLYLNGKKIAGILTETDGERVIVGIGINVNTKLFPANLPLAGSLNVNDISFSALASRIVSELLDIVLQSDKSFMDEYRSRSMLLGNKVSYRCNNVLTYATAVAIDDCGRLIVSGENGPAALSSGEVEIVL